MKLAYRPACHSRWWCEEQFCIGAMCCGTRAIAGFRWDDDAGELIVVLHSDIAEPPAAFSSDEQTAIAGRHAVGYLDSHWQGSLYCAWHSEKVLACTPWRGLEPVGYRCTQDGDPEPAPTFSDDLDWMVLSSEWFPPCR